MSALTPNHVTEKEPARDQECPQTLQIHPCPALSQNPDGAVLECTNSDAEDLECARALTRQRRLAQ